MEVTAETCPELVKGSKHREQVPKGFPKGAFAESLMLFFYCCSDHVMFCSILQYTSDSVGRAR